MHKKTCLQKIINCMICLTIAIVCNMKPVHVDAFQSNLEKEAELTVSFRTETAYCKDTNFSLYYIAAFSDTGDYVLTKEFRDTGIFFEKLDDEQWKVLADKLNNYITRKRTNILPLKEEKTDKHGDVIFSGLKQGLYLIIGESFEGESATYTPLPVLVRLPQRTLENTLEYEVNAIAKYTLETKNEPEKMPPTGEFYNFDFLFALVALGGVLFICCYKRGHERKMV